MIHISDDFENISFNYLDRTIDSEPGDESDIVHKPDFEKCPQPPSSLDDWIQDGWQHYKSQIIVIEEKQLDLSQYWINETQYIYSNSKLLRI